MVSRGSHIHKFLSAIISCGDARWVVLRHSGSGDQTFTTPFYALLPLAPNEVIIFFLSTNSMEVGFFFPLLWTIFRIFMKAVVLFSTNMNRRRQCFRASLVISEMSLLFVDSIKIPLQHLDNSWFVDLHFRILTCFLISHPTMIGWFSFIAPHWWGGPRFPPTGHDTQIKTAREVKGEPLYCPYDLSVVCCVVCCVLCVVCSNYVLCVACKRPTFIVQSKPKLKMRTHLLTLYLCCCAVRVQLVCFASCVLRVLSVYVL